MTNSNQIIIFERNQETLATLTLSFTFFFDSLDVDDTLGDFLSKILNVTTPHATWYRTHETPRNSTIPDGIADRCVTLVKDALYSKTDCFMMFDSGENTFNAIGSWSLKYTSAPSYQGDVLGYIQVHMPYNQTESEHETILDFLYPWLDKINFLHGYAGLSINFDHGDVDKERNLAMRGFCERHLGVNLSDLVTERRYLRNHVKGAQWLTFIGNELLRRHEAAANRLKANKGATTTSQGLLIRACEKPLIGDRHQREDMSAYESINRLIAPWLVDNLFPMPGFPDEEATRAWLHRLRPNNI